MFRKMSMLLFAVIVGTLLLTACGGEEATATPPPEATKPPAATTPPEPTETAEPVAPAEPTTLRIGIDAEIGFFDPQRIQSDMDLVHSAYLYSRLVFDDPSMMDPKPDLAESWTVSEDGMTYVFKLREDVKFHTGRGFTAEDMVFSWDRAINEIADKGRGAGELGDVVSYEATGPYEFTVTLNKVSPVFLTSMFHWSLPALDKETIGQIDTNPVGTGPYRFVEYVPGDRLILEKFADYYDKEAQARWPDRVVIIPIPQVQTRVAALKTGEIDLAHTIDVQFLDEIRDTPGLHVIEQQGGLSTSYMTLAFNLREGITADKRVRQAIQYAIDKEAIHKAVFFETGEVGCSLIPMNHWAYMPITCPERDIEKAKQLLAEAGYPDGLKLTYKPEAIELTQKMAEVVKQSLAEAGIEIEIVILDDATWLDEVWFGHNFEITDAWYTREPDPDGLMQSVLRKEKGNNVMGYVNPRVEELFDAGKSTLDREERKEIYRELMEIVVLDEVPVIKIQSTARFSAANEHVMGAYVNPKGLVNYKDFTFVPNP